MISLAPLVIYVKNRENVTEIIVELIVYFAKSKKCMSKFLKLFK